MDFSVCVDSLAVLPAGVVSARPQLCRLWQDQVQETQVSYLLKLPLRSTSMMHCHLYKSGNELSE